MSDHEGQFAAKVGAVYRTVVLASYHEEKVAALEAELARMRAGQAPACPGCNGTGGGVDMGDCAQVACMCNGTGVLTTPQPSAVPAGWKLVPVEPTPEMAKVSTWDMNSFYSASKVWADMLAAAPSAPATVQGVNQQLLRAQVAVERHSCSCTVMCAQGDLATDEVTIDCKRSC